MLIPFKNIVRKYGKPKGILHIGANIGEEAKTYHDEGVEKVIWFEGNPELFPQLNENVSKYPGQKAYNNCIGDYDGEVVLHIANNGGQSSSILELGTHKQAHPEVHYIKDVPVKINRIDTLHPLGMDGELKGIDFLNCDVQGNELAVLKGMGDLIINFRFAYLECNKAQVYKGCPDVAELDRYLKRFGFRRVETKWCGDWGDGLWVKR